MKLPYYYTFTLHSPLSIKEIRARLVASSDPAWKPRKMAPPAHLSLEMRHAPRMDDGGMRKYQKLEVRDWGRKGGTFYPNCFLRAEDRGSYCLVKLKFRPFVLYSIFMAIWTTGMLVGSISIGVETLLHRPLREALFLVMFVPFYAGFWFFHWATYSSEIPKYMKRLREILAVPDDEDPVPPAGQRPQPTGLARPDTGSGYAKAKRPSATSSN